MRDRWKQELRGFYSAVLFILGTYLVFESWEIALLFTISLGLHELGHVLAAWRFGLDWEMGFGLLGAWTRTPVEQRRALDQFANSLIHVAGPLFSLGLAVLALGIAYSGGWLQGNRLWLRIANFNALLCVLNLLPLGRLSDGGKLIHRLFRSATRRFAPTLLAMAGAFPLVAAWILLTLRLDWERIVALLLVVLWFTLSMMLERRQDDSAPSPPPQPMARLQVGILTSVLVATLTLGTAIALITPFWLTRAEALHMVIDLVSFAIRVLWIGPTSLRLGVAAGLFIVVFLMVRSVARTAGWHLGSPSLLDPSNRLFGLARSGRRLAGWGLALTMAQVFIFVGGTPATVLILYMGIRSPQFSLGLSLDRMLAVFLGTTQAQVTLLILGFAPIALLVWAWVAWYERRPFWTIGLVRRGATKKGPLGMLLRGGMIGVGTYAAAMVLLLLTGSARVAPRAGAGPGFLALVLPIVMILAWAVQGSTEEILFRGWLMSTLGARYRPWVGVLLSAVSFAVVHGLNFGVTWLAFLNLVLIGVFLSFYALWEGALWGACGFHLAWNWAEGNVFGLEVSGIPPAGGALFHLVPSGSPAVTGGAFGPEGGLAVTVAILAATCGMLMLALARAPRPRNAAQAVATDD